jgi:hypothetical protein
MGLGCSTATYTIESAECYDDGGPPQAAVGQVYPLAEFVTMRLVQPCDVLGVRLEADLPGRGAVVLREGEMTYVLAPDHLLLRTVRPLSPRHPQVLTPGAWTAFRLPAQARLVVRNGVRVVQIAPKFVDDA